MITESIASYLPLFYVFMSGFGFSVQSLIVKLLEIDGYHASLQCVFSRGFMQFILSSVVVYFDKDRSSGIPGRFRVSYFYEAW